MKQTSPAPDHVSWPNLGQWEWAIGELIILPLLFFELYRLRRSQRRDHEKAEAADAAGKKPLDRSDTS